jgi:hypothetical protein
MAQSETNVVNDIMKSLAPHGVTLIKNVRGQFYTKDGVLGLIAAARSLNPTRIIEAIRRLRQVSAGLQAAGSGDLIGGTRVTITPDMVGKRILVFTALEVKSATGTASPAQRDFCEYIIENGGYSGIVRSPADAKKICGLPLD